MASYSAVKLMKMTVCIACTVLHSLVNSKLPVLPDGPYITGPQEVIAYQTYRLKCSANRGFPAPTLKWRFGHRIHLSSANITNNFDATYNVSITRDWKFVSQDNDELVICDMTHTSENKSVAYTVRVRNAALVTVSDMPTTVLEGGTVTLFCSVGSQTDVRVYWVKGGNKVNTSSGHFLDGNSKEHASLRILNVTSGDRGKYVCQAENVEGTVHSKDVELIVEYKPKVSITPQITIINIKKPTILKCVFDGSLPITYIQWVKIDWNNNNISTTINITGNFSSPDHLNISNEETSAIYYCKVFNSLGEGTSEITFVGKLSVPRACNVSFTVPGYINSITSLKCCTKAFPPPYFYKWTYNNTELMTDTETLYVTPLENSSAYFGVYTCQALNTMGMSENISITLTPTERDVKGPYKRKVPTYIIILIALLSPVLAALIILNIFCCYISGYFDSILRKFDKHYKVKRQKLLRRIKLSQSVRSMRTSLGRSSTMSYDLNSQTTSHRNDRFARFVTSPNLVPHIVSKLDTVNEWYEIPGDELSFIEDEEIDENYEAEESDNTEESDKSEESDKLANGEASAEVHKTAEGDEQAASDKTAKGDKTEEGSKTAASDKTEGDKRTKSDKTGDKRAESGKTAGGDKSAEGNKSKTGDKTAGGDKTAEGNKSKTGDKTASDKTAKGNKTAAGDKTEGKKTIEGDKTAGGTKTAEGKKTAEGDKSASDKTAKGNKTATGDKTKGKKTIEGDKTARGTKTAKDDKIAEGNKTASEKTADSNKTAGEKTAAGNKTAGEKTVEGNKTANDKTAAGNKTANDKTANDKTADSNKTAGEKTTEGDKTADSDQTEEGDKAEDGSLSDSENTADSVNTEADSVNTEADSVNTEADSENTEAQSKEESSCVLV